MGRVRLGRTRGGRDLRRRGGLAALLAVLASCGPAAAPHSVAAVTPVGAVDATVFLIGDGGEPRPESEPVLTALAFDLASSVDSTVVVFLGDNLYPRGLPAETDPWRREGERRLADQIAAPTARGFRSILVPGNHDWAHSGDSGWANIKRQGRYVKAASHGLARVLPRDGCPDPTVVDLGTWLRVVALDSQWWLHPGPKPTTRGSGCATYTRDMVLDSLAGALRDAGAREVVVVAHHPIRTGGRHGGSFDWKAHLFPLRELHSWLWIPVPVIGSLYPLARSAGIELQDLNSAPYRRYRHAVDSVFAPYAPLVYAAGHDHNLQVIEGEAVQFILVSGSGIFGHESAAFMVDGSVFARGVPGYMRVDALRNGRVRLGVIEVDDLGQGHEIYSQWLK